MLWSFLQSINNTADTKKTIHLVFQKELLIYYSNLSERRYTVFGKKKKKNQILKLPCLDSDLINEVSEVAWLVG